MGASRSFLLEIVPEILERDIEFSADSLGMDGALIDALGVTCGASAAGLFWYLALQTKRGGDRTTYGIAQAIKQNEGRIRKAALALESSGFILIHGKETARKSGQSVGRWFAKNRHRYPANWEEIATRIKTLAGWKCEACGNPHGGPPHVLTVDHCVDHDPMNVADDNLAALCQRCHLRRHGMRPKPMTKEDAIRRLRDRYEREQAIAQTVMEGV